MFESINLKSEMTDTGWRLVATATCDKRYIDRVTRWAKQEAEAGRLMTIENLPDDLRALVIVEQH